MNFDDLKKILTKSGNQMTLVGFLPLAIGAGILVGAIVEGKMAYWITGIIFLAIGILMLVLGIKGKGEVKNNSHPILKAILEKDQDFVVWIYDKRIKSKVEGIQVGQTSNLVVIYKNGKGTEIILGKNKNIDALITYLGTEFPNAELGYSDDSRAKISQLLGKKY